MMTKNTSLLSPLPRILAGLLALAAAVSLVFAQDDEEEFPHGDFDGDCFACHSDEGWKPLQLGEDFVHGRRGFKLDGAHGGLDCVRCHVDLDFTKARTDCVECHQDIHRSEFGTDCARCHTTTSFVRRGLQLRLHRTTRFPLSGVHTTLDCERCHAASPAAAPVYVGTPSECEACHIDDYRGTSEPNHTELGFPTDCAACHSPTVWDRARFDHARTEFPLVGSHRGLSCSECHFDGVYDGKPTACRTCHTQDYTAASDPDHRAAGFSTDCESCHAVSTWGDGRFDHAATEFPLTGSHAPLPCAACHADRVYAGKPSDCYSCHRDEYETTSDPNHRAAGFPTDCAACHGTNRWGDAEFDHDALYFPIYSGPHREAWSDCSDCHLNPSNYSFFSCLDCHEHSDQQDVDDDHSEVSGYSYDSMACYQCHPQGRSD